MYIWCIHTVAGYLRRTVTYTHIHIHTYIRMSTHALDGANTDVAILTHGY